MATFNNEQFQPLPFEGTNIVLRRNSNIMPHFKPEQVVDCTPSIDIAAWEAYNKQVREKRTIIYENSLYKSIFELYSQYPSFAHKSKFMVAETPSGSWLADLGFSWVYVEDAAQLATLSGRTVDRNFLMQAISPVTDKGEALLVEQANRLSSEYCAVCDEGEKLPKATTEVVEVYDQYLQLLCICPTSGIAAKETQIPITTIDSALKNYNLCHGKYYFRYFYDNNFCVKNRFPYEQVMDGRVVNRFASVNDAAKRLDIQPFAIRRLIREGNKIDQYGCHWRKV
jgi:hypothetical protein